MLAAPSNRETRELINRQALTAIAFICAAASLSSPVSAAEPGPVLELSSLACPRIVQPVLTGSEFTKDLPLNVDVTKVCACAGRIVSQDPHLQSLNAGPRETLKTRLQDKRFAAYFFQRTLQASFSCSAGELGIALDGINPYNNSSGGG